MPLQRESPIKRTKIARMGGIAAQASGRAHKLNPQTARDAANKRWAKKRLEEQREEALNGNANEG